MHEQTNSQNFHICFYHCFPVTFAFSFRNHHLIVSNFLDALCNRRCPENQWHCQSRRGRGCRGDFPFTRCCYWYYDVYMLAHFTLSFLFLFPFFWCSDACLPTWVKDDETWFSVVVSSEKRIITDFSLFAFLFPKCHNVLWFVVMSGHG